MPGPEMETLSLGAQLASLLLQIEICNLSQEILYGSRQVVHGVPGIGQCSFCIYDCGPRSASLFNFNVLSVNCIMPAFRRKTA